MRKWAINRTGMSVTKFDWLIHRWCFSRHFHGSFTDFQRIVNTHVDWTILELIWNFSSVKYSRNLHITCHAAVIRNAIDVIDMQYYYASFFMLHAHASYYDYESDF